MVLQNKPFFLIKNSFYSFKTLWFILIKKYFKNLKPQTIFLSLLSRGGTKKIQRKKKVAMLYHLADFVSFAFARNFELE